MVTPPRRLTQRADELMRIGSARVTEHIALRWGRSLPMYIGCGYPKSGTVWLCKLMSAYLGVPYPQNYRLPIAMSSVIHAHWDYDARLPPTAYIHRDGRDVMVSLYFHRMRTLTDGRNPAAAQALRRRFGELYGPDFDPDDVRGNLPTFIESEFTTPASGSTSWLQHIQDWCQPRRSGVAYVSYEELLIRPEDALGQLMRDLTGNPADPEKVRLACARQDFTVQSGRARGSEDRKSFMRSGTAGGWTEHFSPAAAHVFDRLAGEALVDLGYARPGWAAEVIA